MNNRFMFRAWLVNEKRYLDWEYLRLCADLGDILNRGSTQCQVIEQCTGLKDINGKLIYEGDIVCIVEYSDYYLKNAIEKRQVVEIINSLKVPSYNEPAFINKNHSQLIIWDNKRATFMMKDRINITGRPESLRNKRYVVIGNIHENS